MGHLRGFAHAIASNPSLAAHRLTVLTELTLWPCPLTVLENWLEAKAGVQPYEGGFLLHYLDKLVYPDVSAAVLTVAGVIFCAFNLALNGRQAWKSTH